MMKRTITHALLAATFAAVSAVPAHAATVAMITKYAGRDGGEDQYQQDVVYTAAPGEANALVVRGDHQRMMFEDTGAQIEARGGCTLAAPHIAVCEPPDSFGQTSAALGDGDDSARLEAADTYAPLPDIDAGPGDDTVRGGIGFDVLFAGAGDDFVDGGAGGDTINGGGGRDELRAGGVADGFDFIEDGDTDENADADVIVVNGVGYYQTTVSYRSRTEGVTVDLVAGDAGAAGEGDRIIGGLHHVEGGTGSDILMGTGDADFLRGNGGDDRIYGNAGDDAVLGQRGQDLLYAGPGDDTVGEESDNAFDVVRCGDGKDYVPSSDARDRLIGDCEEAAWASTPDSGTFANRISVRPKLAVEHVTFGSTCNYLADCTGRIELRTPTSRKLLGSGRFKIPRSTKEPDDQPREPIRVPLTDRGVDRLKRGGYVRVVITARHDCQGCLNPPPPAKHGFTTYMRR
jgi:hypothetical protein